MSQWTPGVRRLARTAHPCHHTGMDTSTTPSISPALEPETMMALMLRYVEGREEVAHQYARTLLGAERRQDLRGGGGGEPNQRRSAAADQPRMGRADRLSCT